MKNKNLKIPKNPAIDLLLGYLDGEGTGLQRDAIRSRIEESEAWRQEYDRARRFRQGLRDLPVKNPPKRVWEAVSTAVKSTHQRTVWFPWYYANSLWSTAIRVVPVCLLVFLTVSLIWMEGTKSPYNVVVMKDSNGFGLEAESYVAHHDLSVEPSLTRETLIAYYTYDWPE